jgi:hypothetical protein
MIIDTVHMMVIWVNLQNYECVNFLTLISQSGSRREKYTS